MIEDDDHIEIRDAVQKLCAKFPDSYWRELDRERAYPTDFVQALNDAGYLSILMGERPDRNCDFCFSEPFSAAPRHHNNHTT